jgi:hypothetical protein
MIARQQGFFLTQAIGRRAEQQVCASWWHDPRIQGIPKGYAAAGAPVFLA